MLLFDAARRALAGFLFHLFRVPFSRRDEGQAQLRRSGPLRDEREKDGSGLPFSKATTLTFPAQVLGLVPLSHHLQAFKNTPETQ